MEIFLFIHVIFFCFLSVDIFMLPGGFTITYYYENKTKQNPMTKTQEIEMFFTASGIKPYVTIQ